MDQNIKDILETVNFIKEKMVTKDELPELVRPIIREELKPVEDRLIAVESKVSGTNQRLDAEAIQRTDQKLPTRVSDLEVEVFGDNRAPRV